jgi:RNA polymerase sigma-70 factor, ECF subfamily
MERFPLACLMAGHTVAFFPARSYTRMYAYTTLSLPMKGTGMADPPWADADDATLVIAAQLDRRAFAPLYMRYVEPVYRYCVRWLGVKEAAEDVTAHVFARAMDALPRFRNDGPSFRSWLFAIAHNALVDAQRAQRPTGSFSLAAVVPDGRPGPEDQALADEEQRTVLELLSGLAPEQRRVLELRLAGLTTKEIAAVLGRSPEAVRMTQSRAAARLREMLGSSREGVASGRTG